MNGENNSQFDENYFKNRGLEHRFFNDLNAWMNVFGEDTTFCFLGCGLGHHCFAADYYETDTAGCDLEYPIKNSPYKEIEDKLFIADIGKDDLLKVFGKKYDCVVAYDVLEHLSTVKDVEYALNESYKLSNKYLIVSVPWIGNNNLDADPTHKIKKSKQWWYYKVNNVGFDIMKVPEHFPFYQQLIIGIKNEQGKME